MQSVQKISNLRISHKKKQINNPYDYLKINQITSYLKTAPIQQKSTEEAQLKYKQFSSRSPKSYSKYQYHNKIYSHRTINQNRSKSISQSRTQQKRLPNFLVTQMQQNLYQTESITHKNVTRQPIHSRKTNKFKIVSGCFRKNRMNFSETLSAQKQIIRQNQLNMRSCLSIDNKNKKVVQVRKQTLNDFNQYCFKYINRIQKEASRQVRTAEKEAKRNRIHFVSRGNKRQVKQNTFIAQQDANAWRPWSRQNQQELTDSRLNSPFNF